MIASKRNSLGVRQPSDKHGSVLGARRLFYVPPTAYTGLSAWYDINDINSLIYDGSNRVQLVGDKSGNSVRCLCLNGANANGANFTALTAFSTSDFTVSARIRASSLAATGFVWGGTNNAFGLKLNTSGSIQSTLRNVADNTASTGTVSVFADVVVTYVRSGTTGTYYIDAVSAGTTSDSRNYSVGTDALGNDSNAAKTNVLNGNVKWGRVYSVALTALQVAADAAGTVQSNCIFNADFSVPANLATSFTESSSNAATVTINTSGDLGARISGERDLVQMTASKQPILTIAATGNYITFDGTDDYMKAAAFSLSQPETVYFVGSQVSWSSGDYILDGNSSNTLAIAQTTSTPRVSISAGSTVAENANWTIGTNNVVTAVYNGASSALRVGLGTETTGNAGAGNANGIMLGSLGGSANFGNFTNSGLIVYAAAHPTSTQNRLINYLARQNSITL